MRGFSRVSEFEDYTGFRVDHSRKLEKEARRISTDKRCSASTLLFCRQKLLLLQDLGIERFRGLTLRTSGLDTGFGGTGLELQGLGFKTPLSHGYGGFGVLGFGFGFYPAPDACGRARS